MFSFLKGEPDSTLGERRDFSFPLVTRDFFVMESLISIFEKLEPPTDCRSFFLDGLS
jgi:hypothetical protein